MSSLRYAIGPDLVPIANIPIAEPHPATFEHQAWYFQGDGAPVWSGPARVTWNYENQLLTAVAWNELQSFIGSGGYGLVYIRTRTDEMTETGEYKYEIFQAIMNRPKGRPVWGERFSEVSVDFRLIHNPAKGFDANPDVNVTLFPGYGATTSSSTSTSTSTTSTSSSTTSTSTTITSTSTTVTSTSTTSTSSSTTSTSSSTTSTSTSGTSTSTSTTSTSSSTTSTSISTTSISTSTTSTSTTITSTSTTLWDYDILDLPLFCDRPVSMAVDEARGYLYVGTLTSPGRVVAIDLSVFEVVKTLILSEEEAFLYAMVIDVDRGFLLVGTYTEPARVVKIGIVITSLDEFTKIGTIVL